MELILKNIYNDLMKIKDDKGEVSRELQTQYANTIQKRFGRLTPADITEAIAEFKSEELLADDICDKLESDWYLRSWQNALKGLADLDAEISNRRLSREKVLHLIGEINAAHQAKNHRKRLPDKAKSLLSVLDTDCQTDNQSTGELHCLLLNGVLRSFKRSSRRARGLLRAKNATAQGVASAVLAEISCSLHYLADIPHFATYLKEVSDRYNLVRLAGNNKGFNDYLSAYPSVDLGRTNLPGLISAYRKGVREFIDCLKNADVFV